MAGELKHKSVGTDLSQAEFEDIELHTLDGQTTGDLIIATSATQLGRLPKITTGQYLKATDTGYEGSIPSIDPTQFRQKPFIFTDFLGAAGAVATEAATGFDFAVISSGTQAKIAGEASHPGILRIKSSTTANSGGYCMLEPTAFLIAGGEVFEIIFQHRVASGTNTIIRMGFHDTKTYAEPVDGAYAEILAGSLNLSGKTSSNSTRSTTGTNYTLTVNTWYRLKVVVNADATRVDFYLYDDSGTQLWTDYLTTNIPTATGRQTGAGLIATNSGTTATLLAYFDWMAVWSERALTR